VSRYADEIRALIPRAAEAMEGLSASQLNFRQAEGSWSIAECIDHLNVSNEHYAAAIEAAIAKGPAPRPGTPPKLGLIERWFLKQMEPPAKMKVKAPTKFQPGTAFDKADLLERWRVTHEQLALLAEKAEAVDLGQTKVVSPVSSFFKFSLLCILQVLPAHDRRHLWQAAKVREKMKTTPPAAPAVR
jgi:hypothetical protein